jgi:hypothetical protein
METLTLPARPRRAVPPRLTKQPSLALLRAAGVGFVLAFFPVAVPCLFSPKATWLEAYTSLYRWDGEWYERIVSHGYQLPPEWEPGLCTSLAFFPGYPLTASLLQRVTGLDSILALLVTAQLACWGFWTVLLLLFHRWRVPVLGQALAVLVLGCQPGAFFLIASYSESLFLLTLLLYLSLFETRRPGMEVLGAVAGTVMTATRIVGAPLAIYPFARSVLYRERPRRMLLMLVLGGVAALGTLAFFGWCWLCLGRWDWYFAAEKIGWGVEPRYSAVFEARTYDLSAYWIRHSTTFLNIPWVNISMTNLLAVGFVVLILGELLLAWWRNGDTDWRGRAGYYLCGLFLFWSTVSGRAAFVPGRGRPMEGMLRYALPIVLLQVLAITRLLMQTGWPTGWRRIVPALAIVLVCAVALYCQTAYLRVFMRGGWVA